MLASVLTKTLRDQGRSLLAWSVSLALIVAMYAAVWPSVRDQPSMSDFIDQMPEAFRSMFATSGADMSTPTGYIQIELLSFMGPIAILIYAVGAGARAIGGEEDRHTMDLLLSNPVGRGRVVLDKFLAMAVGTFLLAAVMGVSLVLEGKLVDLQLPADKVAATMLHLALLGVVFGALALALSAGTGRTGLSRGVPGALAVYRLHRQRTGAAGGRFRPGPAGLAVLPVHRARPAAAGRCLGRRRRLGVHHRGAGGARRRRIPTTGRRRLSASLSYRDRATSRS